MDLERLFDLACYMADSETGGSDYMLDSKKGIKLNYKQQKSVLKKSIQAFMHKTGVMNENKIIQAFSGSSALPVMTKDIFNVTQETPNFDLLWENSFKGIQLRKGELSWEIADVAESMVFELVPEGGKCKFFNVSGSKQIVDIQKYASGLGLTWETIEGRKLYKFIDQMTMARNKLYKLWADIHYGLLATAAAMNTVAWQGVTADPTVERDIATINKGYTTIGVATKDSGYGDTANAPMLIYASPLLRPRFGQAFRATSSDIVRGRVAGASSSKAGQVLEYNVTPYYSYNSAITANKALMILP